VCLGLVGTLEWWVSWEEEMYGEDVVVSAGCMFGVGTD